MWPDRTDRWDYTWAELGKYDVPAAIDLILEETGRDKLTYYGYSQGNS